jgi:diguanylate cyclase (GGDEF)-like protein/PAS domain S-box-containing protein
MKNSYEFLSLVLDSITEHIAVIDDQGEIQYVNNSWSIFGSNNECAISYDWSGVNYIEECDRASLRGDEYGTKAGSGIRSVIDQNVSNFYFEYPCHSLNEKRWFMMRITPFQVDEKKYFVISHQDVTERKLAENEVKNLASLDGLTDIPNRRAFDEFLSQEWKRCARSNKPISLAIIDIDYFKLLNDTYGHQSGDECLVKIGVLLKKFVNRPSDMCARYGGDEFVLAWGDTSLDQSLELVSELLQKIIDLNIPNCKSPTSDYLTASIGLAELLPNKTNRESELISNADSMLYKAKESGRNKIKH